MNFLANHLFSVHLIIPFPCFPHMMKGKGVISTSKSFPYGKKYLSFCEERKLSPQYEKLRKNLLYTTLMKDAFLNFKSSM